MKNNKLYKYINLLLRIVIGLLAIIFIYYKIEQNFNQEIVRIKQTEIYYSYLFVAFFLLFVNWGIESFKWKYTIKAIDSITFLKAFKYVFTGITIGLLTPNRIGEIPARAMLVNRNKFKEITLKTAVSSYAQLLITLFCGTLALYLKQDSVKTLFDTKYVLVGLFILTYVLYFLYFNINKVSWLIAKIKFLSDKDVFKALTEFTFLQLNYILLLSFFRFIVFSFQYFLVLKAFGVALNSWDNILLIPICFMITSVIPTILISEIAVRGSVALLVFGTISLLNTEIIIASIVLWIINVACPALLGLTNLKQFKMFKES